MGTQFIAGEYPLLCIKNLKTTTVLNNFASSRMRAGILQPAHLLQYGTGPLKQFKQVDFLIYISLWLSPKDALLPNCCYLIRLELSLQFVRFLVFKYLTSTFLSCSLSDIYFTVFLLTFTDLSFVEDSFSDLLSLIDLRSLTDFYSFI